MLVPPELSAAPPQGVTHGLDADRKPELHHIQAVLDNIVNWDVVASRLKA